MLKGEFGHEAQLGCCCDRGRIKALVLSRPKIMLLVRRSRHVVRARGVERYGVIAGVPHDLSASRSC